jgi:hypothetical protein
VTAPVFCDINRTLSYVQPYMLMAVPWLRRLVAGFPPRRPGFDPGSVQVGFVVDKVALGKVFSRVLRFSSVNFIPPVSIIRKNEKTDHLHHRVAQ